MDEAIAVNGLKTTKHSNDLKDICRWEKCWLQWGFGVDRRNVESGCVDRSYVDCGCVDRSNVDCRYVDRRNAEWMLIDVL